MSAKYYLTGENGTNLLKVEDTSYFYLGNGAWVEDIEVMGKFLGGDLYLEEVTKDQAKIHFKRILPEKTWVD